MKQRMICWSILGVILLVMVGCAGKRRNVKIIGLDTPSDTEPLAEPQPSATETAPPREEPHTTDRVLVEGFGPEPKIEVDVFIMSQCPYGVQVIPGMRDVLDQFGGEVKVNVNYIGTESDGELNSMHGEKEVQGNIDQLCARKIAPTEMMYWDFLQCVNEDWREIPENDTPCAEKVQLSVGAFEECRHGTEGQELLRESFNLAKSKRATGSPTIFVDGARYSGNRSSSGIAQFICANHGQSKDIKTCETLPKPPEVELFAITDSRCGEECDVTKMVSSLNGIFLNMNTTVLDWSEPLAKEIMREAEIQKLPALVFNESAKNDESGFKHMERWFSKTGSYYQVKVKSVFDPTAEICDNNIDDTNNGKVDCKDKTCKNTLMCRKNTPKKLELFLMSQCPFGAMAVLAMDEVLEAFKKDINFKIHYIANTEGERITSMHGQPEVDEDMRWLCAKKHYPKHYLDYVWCRADDYKDPDWEKCATGKIKKKVVQKCMDSGQGEALLRKDLQLAIDLGFGASPTWVANGRHQFSGVVPNAIQEGYCKVNPNLSGCEVKLSSERVTNAPAGTCGSH